MSTECGKFSSKIGFIPAAAGSAVGLGNIWRFPYETGFNGGAALEMALLYSTCLTSEANGNSYLNICSK